MAAPQALLRFNRVWGLLGSFGFWSLAEGGATIYPERVWFSVVFQPQPRRVPEGPLHANACPHVLLPAEPRFCAAHRDWGCRAEHAVFRSSPVRRNKARLPIRQVPRASSHWHLALATDLGAICSRCGGSTTSNARSTCIPTVAPAASAVCLTSISEVNKHGVPITNLGPPPRLAHLRNSSNPVCSPCPLVNNFAAPCNCVACFFQRMCGLQG
jgi:hypothetical protein